MSSGFEMTVEKSDAGYTLEKLTIDGQELDRNATYSVAVIGSMALMLEDALKASHVTEYTAAEALYKEILVDYLAGGSQLAEPSSYITLH